MIDKENQNNKISVSITPESYSNSLYLGGVDSNALLYKEIDTKVNQETALSIRRKIMHRLLSWDNVVISDSQMLNNPCLRELTSFTQGKNVSDPTKPYYWQRGLEHLISSDLIKIASREKNGQPLSMYRVWEEMNNRINTVPNLPENGDYPWYIDEIKAKRKTFLGSEAGNRFKKNLYSGIPYFSGNNDICAINLDIDKKEDSEIIEILECDSVLFSTLLEKIIDQYRHSNITKARLNELYRYFFSCYCINVPMLTDSFIEFQRTHIPLHIEAGVGDFCIEPENADYSNLRPSFSVNPKVMDYISFDEFLDIRKNLEKDYINNELMYKYNTGNLTEDDWDGTFQSFWSEYTAVLERELRLAIQNERIKELERRIPADQTFQRTLTRQGLELVCNFLLNNIPGGGTIQTLKEMHDKGENLFVTFSNRHTNASINEKLEVLKYLSLPDVPYITKYPDK